MGAPLVLVVDDESDLRTFLEALLIDAGYRVQTAANGLEALERMQGHVPDALLLDLNMPVLDGFGVLERVRAAPRLALVPVIILSGHDDGENVTRGLELGADEYLLKPFSTWELVARLATLLRMIEFRRRLTLEAYEASRQPSPNVTV